MINIPFTNPFRYSPHPLVRKAAREVMERLDGMITSGLLPEEVARGFTEGKMLGVLVCHSGERSDVGIRSLNERTGPLPLPLGEVPPQAAERVYTLLYPLSQLR